MNAHINSLNSCMGLDLKQGNDFFGHPTHAMLLLVMLVILKGQ